MSSLTNLQRAKVNQFIEATGSNSRVAGIYLRSHSWRVDAALNDYHDNASSYGTQKSKKSQQESKALQVIFDKFRDPEEPLVIGIDGTISLFQELGVDLEDPVALAIAYKLEAPSVARFERDGFVNGWVSLGADSISSMKSAVDKIRTDFENDQTFFKQVYLFTFPYIRPEGTRVVQLEAAIDYWDLLLKRLFPSEEVYDKWIKYLNEEYKRSISKDTWNSLYDFVVNVLGSTDGLEQYDAEGAWPSIFDAFVEFLKA
ncbi:Cullin binding-domain-containing protein [Lipomyces japonicus]|uniref:Cullin binding-domain-containing protein n=1 Tax=Lipomyces japonicus TaxID=56871 RepID=UPI0034CE8F2A